MKNCAATVLLFVSVAVLTGCANVKSILAPEPHWKPAAEEPVGVQPTIVIPMAPKQRDFLAYFSFLQRLTDVELGKEYRAVKQRFENAADEEDRWRLIFLSILPGQSFSNREYALDLLRGSRQQSGLERDPRAGLSKLLSLLLADQIDINRKLGEEKQRAEKLAQQLQELKEIENILSEREKKRPVAQ